MVISTAVVPHVNFNFMLYRLNLTMIFEHTSKAYVIFYFLAYVLKEPLL